MKQITCIVCPRGCRITCEEKDGAMHFSGNGCKRGLAYAQSELTCPMRTLCTTVKTAFPEAPALPVRTSAPIKKALVREVVRALSDVVVTTRAAVGDVIVPNVLNTQSDIICTSDLLRR